jgi:hypothetical protein
VRRAGVAARVGPAGLSRPPVPLAESARLWYEPPDEMVRAPNPTPRREVSKLDGRFVVVVGAVLPGRVVRLPSGARRPPRTRWEAVAWVDDSLVAAAMAELLQDEDASRSTRVMPTATLTASLGSVAADAIRDRLRNPTVVEMRRARELRQLAEERLRTGPERSSRQAKGVRERRSGGERRSGVDRRRSDVAGRAAALTPRSLERRRGERRSGRDRRTTARA